MVCRDFILPEGCKPCLLLSSFQFAKLILPYLYELQECQDFIDSIPQDLREQLKERYEAQLEQEQQFRY